MGCTTSSSALTMRGYFDADFAPLFLAGAAKRTRDAYSGTLSRWRAWSNDPPLRAISSRTLNEFKAKAIEHVSAATVNKHLRHLHHMLAKAGPTGPGNRDALEIINHTPWTKPLRETEGEFRLLSDDELSAWYAACEFARLPVLNGVSPAAWWRALTCASLCLAARRGTLLSLRWAHIDLEQRQLRYSGEHDKARRRRAKPLHAVLVEHLRRIKAHHDLVFTWTKSEITWYRELHRLQDLAGVHQNNRWHFHDLKRTAATLGSASMDLFTLKEFCDHSSVRTTERFYASGRDRLAAAVDALQLPESFSVSSNDRQLLLF